MSTTPQSVDTYSRVMVESFNEVEYIGVPTGFQSLFGRNASKTVYAPNSEDIEIDIQRGNEKIAALIPRGIQGTTISGAKSTASEKWTTFSRVFPLGEEEDYVSAAQLNKRIAGENPYEGMNKTARLMSLTRDKHLEHIRRFIRMFEVLAAQSFRTGVMDAIIGTSDTNQQYDFKRSASNTITVTTGWNQASPTIMADIDSGCEVARQNGKMTPDAGIIGGQAMQAMIEDTTFQGLADNRRFEIIQVSNNYPVPARYAFMVEAGFNARGMLRTAKGYELWLFTYVDDYQNAAGTRVKYMPEDEMIIFSTMARHDRYFGPHEVNSNTARRRAYYQETFGLSGDAIIPPNVKGGGMVVSPAMFYFDAYPDPSEKGHHIRTQTAPIFATTMTDTIVTLNGLIT